MFSSWRGLYSRRWKKIIVKENDLKYKFCHNIWQSARNKSQSTRVQVPSVVIVRVGNTWTSCKASNAEWSNHESEINRCIGTSPKRETLGNASTLPSGPEWNGRGAEPRTSFNWILIQLKLLVKLKEPQYWTRGIFERKTRLFACHFSTIGVLNCQFRNDLSDKN